MAPSSQHFAQSDGFRAWLKRHHTSAKELWILFYKKSSGRGGMIYPEALDEALCFGWIDGVVRSIDHERYCQRFTPRKRTSNWSLRNIDRVKRLATEGRMEPAGLAAFAARTAARSGVYSFEQTTQALPARFEKPLRSSRKAWKFWQAQPDGYRRVAAWWVVSAKQEATRQRRLEKLITDSAAGRRLLGK